jgi:hypothetical protein
MVASALFQDIVAKIRGDYAREFLAAQFAGKYSSYECNSPENHKILGTGDRLEFELN